MSKEESLNNLFNAHVKDLKEVFTEWDEVFICPICMNGFLRDAIKEKTVTDGHVWPKSIRKLSEKAGNMHVLLCANCNHTAGGRGDAQMQIQEKMRKGKKTGKLYGVRKVQLHRSQDAIPINLNVDVTYHAEDKSITITGRLDRNEKWFDSSPEDQARFKETYERKENVEIVIHPPRNYKPELDPAGWITSAYLMGFYSLGYRFILDSNLDPVREYILNSFDKTIKGPPAQLNLDDFGYWDQQLERSADPELLFMLPLEMGKRVYLQVNCLSYVIRLPFRYRPSVLVPILYRDIPDFVARLPAMIERKMNIPFPITSNKLEGQRSWYDDLLGAPNIRFERQ
ncbi:MAG: hypothetical protein HUU38_28055 [Anaerolineales bacterium]|nr:hypothetical protein [Anaerolineales bacterium]